MRIIPVSRKTFEDLEADFNKAVDNFDLMIKRMDNLHKVLDGLLLCESQHSQIESNLAKTIVAIKNKKQYSQKQEDKDTERSYY